MIRALVFDWGNTVMVDFGLPGPMIGWNKTAWIPGAETALKALFKKYTISIASNAGASNKQEMIDALSTVGADQYFSHFFHSKEIGFEKPDQRFFNEVCRSAGFTPGECVMIGDNYEKDIAGAKEFGMKTVFFNRLDTRGDFPQADAVISDMAELPDAIEHL